MSCYNNCYLPQPPRAWSRVQNSCSLTTDETNGLVKIPLTGEVVPASILGEKMAMLNKGNVLQYKANSSNLTKAQRYSKIAKGQWTNRNTTWATQSMRGYTNPNNSNLKRSGNVVNIAIDPITGTIIGPTTAPITCPQVVIPTNQWVPINSISGIDVPIIPPPAPPNPSSDVFPEIVSDTPVEPIVIPDEGVLICSVQENVCTGETKRTISQQLCNLTSDSDVPGQIQKLCWNDGTPTWYPRQRYVMSNSTNKWPVNARLASSVKPYPPVITSGKFNSNISIITLNWTQNDSCIQASVFYIYQNGILIETVPATTFMIDISVSANIGTNYQYFIIAGTSGSVVSDPSNTFHVIV